jgi:hypothetical protein
MLRSQRQAWIWALLVAAPLVGTTGLRAGDGPCHCPHCSQACEPACQKCVRVPDVRKETHVEYRCKKSDICLIHRPLWDLFRKPAATCAHCGGCHDCQACPVETCPQCECHPRRKVVLLKKIETVECPTFKCEAVCLPKQCGTQEMFQPVETPKLQLPEPSPPPVPPSVWKWAPRTTR